MRILRLNYLRGQYLRYHCFETQCQYHVIQRSKCQKEHGWGEIMNELHDNHQAMCQLFAVQDLSLHEREV